MKFTPPMTSLRQLRIAVLGGDARDTRPATDLCMLVGDDSGPRRKPEGDRRHRERLHGGEVERVKTEVERVGFRFATRHGTQFRYGRAAAPSWRRADISFPALVVGRYYRLASRCPRQRKGRRP